MPEMSADGQSLRFILTGDDAASASFAEGTNGNITLELGRSDNALSVPRRAVHTAGDVSFVYVVDEDGYRRYREIKTGLIGDTRIEVLDGLKAGEVVAVNF
jgi:multidrug efflux pump subunit AcrA (membrane-fusion protein)